MSHRTENMNAQNGAPPVVTDRKAKSGVMEPAHDAEPLAARFSRTVPPKCFVCNGSIGDRCFCKIPRQEGEPIMLCCPTCSIQYLDSARAPAITREPELRGSQNGLPVSVAEDEP